MVILQYWTFLYCSPFSYHSSNYWNSNSCRSFTVLKALAKSNGNLFVIAFKSEKERERARKSGNYRYRYHDSWNSDNFRESHQKKKQSTDTKKAAKGIKSDNFTRSNREKYNIAIAILKKRMTGWQHNYFVFWW